MRLVSAKRESFPVRMMYQLLGVPRSSFYD